MPLTSKYVRRAGVLRLLVVAGLGLTACDRPPTEVLPGEGLDPRFAPGGTPVPIQVNVTGLGGAVDGAVVHMIAADGTVYKSAPTVGGTTTVADVPTGNDYCIVVRLAPPSALAEPVLAPATVPAGLKDELPLSSAHSPVLVNKFGNAVAWTANGWTSCLSRPPYKLSGPGATLNLVLPQSFQFIVNLVDPEGVSLFASHAIDEVVAYSITDLGNKKRPGFDPDLKDGFLQFVALSARTDPVDTRDIMRLGLAPGQDFNLEFQQVVTSVAGPNINFTATVKGRAGASGTSETMQQPLHVEPLYCARTTETYPKLQKFVSVNYGYMADPNPDKADLSKVLIANPTVALMELTVKGNEEFTVSFREDMIGGGRTTTDLTFTCANGICGTTSSKTSGGSGHILIPFYRTLDVATLQAKATLFLTGTDPSHVSLTFSAKSKGGEAIPVPDRKNSSASQTPYPDAPVAGSRCNVLESNDDKFWFGIG